MRSCGFLKLLQLLSVRLIERKMIAHKWQPISPLSGDCEYDFSEIDSLQRQWIAYRQEREAGSPGAFRAFRERLTRSWAIETGIIEGLYTLDRGMTETLVTRGISADLIERSATDKDPHELANILTDHQDTVDGVYAEIRAGRPISRSAIRQIHQTLTGNQPTFRAMNRFGQWFDAELRRGEFKTLPNNPTRPDGTIHEYCPPEHVDSELDNLLTWYNLYLQDSERYHPLLTAAWLHHRFTQIHPFQDGNGRVVRALLTWHLIRENYLPVVVKRDDRASYIGTLESADGGNLVPLIDLLAGLQRRTVLEALGEPEPTESTGALDQVLNHVVAQISRQNSTLAEQMRSVNEVARELSSRTADLLEHRAGQIGSRLCQAGNRADYFIDQGGPGDREHWYHSRIVQTARNSGHWMNPNESRFFTKLSLTPQRLPRLVFVVSLHHTGRQLSGVMAATAFALIDHYRDGASDAAAVSATDTFIDCTPLAPFTFTWESEPDLLLPRFTEWTEQSLAIALQQWGQYLT